MKIRQLARHELRADLLKPDRPWLLALCVRLRDLPDHPSSRILVAAENGEPRALLGLRLYWGSDGRLHRVMISVLGVDPEHNRRGIGSRLVRFAEGIARINGCTRVDVAVGVEGWEGGRCWPGLGYEGDGEVLAKELHSVVGRASA